MKFSSKSFRVSTAQYQKREFNPANKADLLEYQSFLKNAKWKAGCPFFVEWPFSNVVSMIEHKIVNHYISNLIKQTVK